MAQRPWTSSPFLPAPTDFEFHPPCVREMEDDEPPASPTLNIPLPHHNWGSDTCHRQILSCSEIATCFGGTAAATVPSQLLEFQRIKPEEVLLGEPGIQLDRNPSLRTLGRGVSGGEDIGCSCLCAFNSSSSMSSCTAGTEEASQSELADQSKLWKLPGSCNGLFNDDDDGAVCRKKLKQKWESLVLNMSEISKATMSGRHKLAHHKGKSWRSSAGGDVEFSSSSSCSSRSSSTNCGSPAATGSSSSAPAAAKSSNKTCSPHARHYQQQRARSHDLKRTTPLPYRPFMAIPGCVGGRATAHVHVPSAARIIPTPTPLQV